MQDITLGNVYVECWKDGLCTVNTLTHDTVFQAKAELVDAIVAAADWAAENRDWYTLGACQGWFTAKGHTSHAFTCDLAHNPNRAESSLERIDRLGCN